MVCLMNKKNRGYGRRNEGEIQGGQSTEFQRKEEKKKKRTKELDN